jgi:hypothetical protein
MKFKDQMHRFYSQKLERLPYLPYRSPEKSTVALRPFRLVPAIQNIIGYSLLGAAGLHYLLTGKFFTIVREFPAIKLLF